MAAISAQAQSTKPAVDSEVEATAQTAESIEDRIAQAAILIESALIGDVLQVWYSPSATSDARRQNFIRWYRQHVEGGSGIRWRRAFVLITSLHTSVLAIYVLLSFVERPSCKGCYFLVFVQLFEKCGILIERCTALIEKVSSFRVLRQNHRGCGVAEWYCDQDPTVWRSHCRAGFESAGASAVVDADD
eukprot:SAG31_NODE_1991_length_6712_cov_6.411311_8_plen_189_part_00